MPGYFPIEPNLILKHGAALRTRAFSMVLQLSVIILSDLSAFCQ